MRLFARAALYFHTLRHLKRAQVWGRVVRRLRRQSLDLNVAPLLRASRDWQPPVARRPSMVGPETFRFLNEDGALPSGKDWRLPDRSMLWLYNMHYFDDLNAAGAPERVHWHRKLVARWIADNPPGTAVAWDPYPTSLRIVNWIKWAWAGNSLDRAARHSLAVQARWLIRRLETHLMGNHLLANAKALVFAGCYFKGHEAQVWLSRGMAILAQEIPEQVLPDGGHFERSTMYHTLALEDMLDLLNLVRGHPEQFRHWGSSVSTWSDVARRMGRWLSTMCHPDGDIAFFNDAAMGIAPKPAALNEYGRRVGVYWNDEFDDGVVWLERSGYVRAQRNGVVLLTDVAPIGPDHLPGHGHADTLTFELSIQGQRVVVNSGTSCYGHSEQRDRERGTAAHNTVEVDGENSSEVWGGFRVARRARPFDVTVRVSDETMRIEGAHDGYCRLRGRVVHRRVWSLRPESLEISDFLDGRFCEAIGRVHFHPAVTVESAGSEGCGMWDGGLLRWQAYGGDSFLSPSMWHPEFGLSLPSNTLALQVAGSTDSSSSRLVLSWV